MSGLRKILTLSLVPSGYVGDRRSGLVETTPAKKSLDEEPVQVETQASEHSERT